MSVMTQDDIAIMADFFGLLGSKRPEVRAEYARMIADMRRTGFAAVAEAPSEAASAKAAELEADGMIDLGAVLTPEAAAEMLAHFRPLPIYPSHALDQLENPQAGDFETVRRTSHYGCYGPQEILRCPHLLELANDPLLLQIAEAYLRCPPTLYSLNAWWSFPQGGAPARYSQSLHRDNDDLRFVTLFLYLTPVDDKAGPHRYIRHSHDKPTLARALVQRGRTPEEAARMIEPLFGGGASYAIGPVAEQLLGDLAFVWRGPAGSAILADTYGLHMGIPPLEGERLMVWARYGIGASKFVFDAQQHAALVAPRLPRTSRAHYINRLMLMV